MYFGVHMSVLAYKLTDLTIQPCTRAPLTPGILRPIESLNQTTNTKYRRCFCHNDICAVSLYSSTLQTEILITPMAATHVASTRHGASRRPSFRLIKRGGLI